MPASGREVVVLAQLFCFICRGGGLAFGLTAVFETFTDIPCGDENGGGDLRIVRDGGGGHVSAHAVADDDDAVRVDAVLLRSCGIEQEADLGVGVLGGVREGEVAFDAPRAAVVHGEHVPAVGAEGLGEVEVLLEAGKAVEDDGGGVRACSGGEIEDAEEIAAVAGQDDLLHGSGRGVRLESVAVRAKNRALVKSRVAKSEGVQGFHGGEYRAL